MWDIDKFHEVHDDFSEDFLLTIKPRLQKEAPVFSVFNVVVNTGFVKASDASLFERFDMPRETARSWFEVRALVVPAATTAAQLMAMLGLFPSIGQARKNGWPGEIPSGWAELRSKRFVIFCWKPTVLEVPE